MIRLSQQTENLARQIALARGISLEDAIRLAIEASSKEIARPAAPGKALAREELIRRMEEISARCGSRPLIDPRSPR